MHWWQVSLTDDNLEEKDGEEKQEEQMRWEQLELEVEVHPRIRSQSRSYDLGTNKR